MAAHPFGRGSIGRGSKGFVPALWAVPDWVAKCLKPHENFAWKIFEPRLLGRCFQLKTGVNALMLSRRRA
jgi:hypothetical protein